MSLNITLITNMHSFSSFEKDIENMCNDLSKLVEVDPMYSFKRATLIESIILQLKHKYNSLLLHEQIELLLHSDRPNAFDCIKYIASDFCPILNESKSPCIAGIAAINSVQVCIIGTLVGRNHDERINYNMGKIDKVAVEKIIKTVEFAKKLDLPVFFFVDSVEAIADKALNSVVQNKNIFIYIIGQCPAVFLLANNKYALEHALIQYVDKSIPVKDVLSDLIPEYVGGAHRNRNAVLAAIKTRVMHNLYCKLYSAC